MITHLHNPVMNNCYKNCVTSSRRGPFLIAECAWMYSLLILNYLYLHAEFAHNPVVLCAVCYMGCCALRSRMDETHFFTFAASSFDVVCTVIPNGLDTCLLCSCLLYFCSASYDAPWQLTPSIGNLWLHFLLALDPWRTVVQE